MSDAKNPSKRDAPDLEDLARRFQDLWQEQLAATASDPEFVEMMGRWFGAFAAGTSAAAPTVGPMGPIDPEVWLTSMQQALARAGAAGKDGADDAGAGAGSSQAGAKTATTASRIGHVGGDELERRLADLEQRVGRLETELAGARKGASRGTRRRKS